jgi:hypothetical protein
MIEYSADIVWELSDTDLLALLESDALLSKTRKVRFYVPSFAYHKMNQNYSPYSRFPTISVTGTKCVLNCKHCGGKLLKTMCPAESPKKLFELATNLKHQGASGCLVSGGCQPNGSVPMEQFYPVLFRLKRELGLTVVVHTGVVSSSTANRLRETGIDAALIDVIGSDTTLKQICNLSITTEHLERSLQALDQSGLNFVPHVIVGLQNGKLEGELQALKMIQKYKPSGLVVIAFMPVRGTVMQSVEPPSSVFIARVATCARLMFPDTPVALGCMRPKGKHRAKTDILALKAGVDAIAFPSEEVVYYAKKCGFEISVSPQCCSQIYAEMISRSISK